MPGLLVHPLFAGVDEDLVTPMLAGIRLREVDRGTVVNATADAAQLIHLVFQGRLGVYLPVPGSRAMLLEVIGPGGVDGLLNAAGYGGHFSQTQEMSLVASVPVPAVARAAAAEPRLNANLLKFVLSRLASRERQLEALARRDPSQRLARQLVGFCDAAGSDREWVEVSVSHQMLADMLAIRRETVTLHLHRLARLGAVTSRGRHYRLHRQALERVCAESRSVTRRP